MAVDPVLKRLLDQNDRLIGLLGEAIGGTNPVEIIRALNPPWEGTRGEERVQTSPNPWEGDTEPPAPAQDPWGDEEITLDRLRMGKVGHGWISTDPPEELAPLVEIAEHGNPAD